MWSLKKFTSAYLFRIAREKPCDYVLVIYMKKNTKQPIIIMQKQSARIKCINNLFKPCIRSKQPRTIKTIIYKDIFTSLKRKKLIVRLNSSRNVQSGLLLLCTGLTLFCIELPENCIYLHQSELSNFYMYLISKVIKLI